MITQAPDDLEAALVIRCEQTSFAGRDDLVAAEREGAGIADGSERPAFVRAPKRLRAIFDHLDATWAGKF